MTFAQSISQRRSRLAWLTPLQISQSFGKSWVLTYTSSQWIASTDTPCTRVTTDALLLLLDATVNTGHRETHAEHGACTTFTSNCGRFEVNWRQQKGTAERLFVQQASDYFQHIELIIDGSTAVTYQEPVWPHLQAPRPKTPTTLSLPTDCIKQLASASTGHIRPPTQAVANASLHNDSEHDVGDQAAAA